MSEEKLVEVRCQFKLTAGKNFHRRGEYIKQGQQYTCNMLCVEVYPPSRGRTKCPRCNLFFGFEVATQSKVNTTVRVEPVK